MEDTVLGTGFWEWPLLDLALLGEEVMSGLSCPAFVRVRVQGASTSLRSQRCAVLSVGLRRLIVGTSKAGVASKRGCLESSMRSMNEQSQSIVTYLVFLQTGQSSLTSSK